MAEFWFLAPASLAGGLLGGYFFGGLWWTVRSGLASRSPARWFLVGLTLRMSVTLLGFHYVGGEDWRRWLSCLVGFVLARGAVERLSRTPAKKPETRASGTRYAS